MPAQEMVTIGCKLPFGLVAELRGPMRVQKSPSGNDAQPGELLAKHTLVGSAPQRRLESGIEGIEVPNVVAGYGLTQVPKDFAEAWFKENATYPPVAKGQIIRWDTLVGAKSMAAERAEIKNGLEPVDPNAKVRVDDTAVIETRNDKDPA